MNKELEDYLNKYLDDYNIKQQKQHDKTMEKLDNYIEKLRK